MKLRRDIAAVPLRSGEDTWSCIIELITASDSIDVSQLRAASSVMGMLLAEEHYQSKPLTLKGNGHRLVIYCTYGTDALIMGGEVDILTWNPTADDWKLYVPCAGDDLEWARKALAPQSPRIVLYGFDEVPGEVDESEPVSANTKSFDIDWSAA